MVLAYVYSINKNHYSLLTGNIGDEIDGKTSNRRVTTLRICNNNNDFRFSSTSNARYASSFNLGIIPIITLLFIKTILTQLQLKSQLARKILEGEPVILVHKGKINMKALSKQQINLDELMEELRLAGYFDLNEIEYAILENNGQLSFLTSSSSASSSSSPSPIVKCSSNTQPTSNSASEGNGFSSDTQKHKSSCKNNKSSSSSPPRLPIIYILDGHINNNSLTSSRKNKAWIQHELDKHKAGKIEEIILAMTDTEGKFFFQRYDEYIEEDK